MGVGAGLSNLISGFIVQAFGYPTGFLSLAGIALCALVFFLTLMPETRRRRLSVERRDRSCAHAGCGGRCAHRRSQKSPSLSSYLRLHRQCRIIGMMLLAEVARQEGLFDWLAAQAATHAHGSTGRLFTLIYLVGIVCAPWSVLRDISCGVLPLVAGLFDRTGLIRLLGGLVEHALGWSATGAAWASGSLVAFASNLMNNLPAGFIAGTNAGHSQPAAGRRRSAYRR